MPKTKLAAHQIHTCACRRKIRGPGFFRHQSVCAVARRRDGNTVHRRVPSKAKAKARIFSRRRQATADLTPQVVPVPPPTTPASYVLVSLDTLRATVLDTLHSLAGEAVTSALSKAVAGSLNFTPPEEALATS